MRVNTLPATHSTNKENLSLPFQDTFHLLRKKGDRELSSRINGLTTETSVPWVMRCHPEVLRTLLCPVPLNHGPKDISDQLGTEGCVDARG